METSSDPAAIIAFVKARLAEDDERARGLQFACRIPEKIPDFTAAGGPAAETYWAHFTPQRMARELEAARRLLDRYERLLMAQERHDVAVAKWRADVDHEQRTGRWAGVGDPGSRLHALLREGDYLTAMIPVARELVTAKAAVWNDHPDYLKEWAL